MRWQQKLAFSVGHVLNDLTAAVWFTYLVAYFQKVLGMGSLWAGYVMLFGQVADALSTTFIGIESDRTRREGCRNYGRRKTWHLFGTLCVVLSFPFIFMTCLGCVPGRTDDWAMFTYYAPFVAMFQFGWAAIQISHLALIPEIAGESEDLRVTLAARRNDFTVASTIAVYLLTWLLFGSKNNGDNGPDLDGGDAEQFELLSLILIGTGLVFTIAFHIFVAETKQVRHLVSQQDRHINYGSIDSVQDRSQRSDRFSWFAKPLFYAIALLYTAVRIILNVSQTILPLYVLETLKLGKDDIATVPLALYVSGFVSSLATPYLHRWIGVQKVVFLGSLFVVGGSIWILFLQPGSMTAYTIYGVASILGAGQQTIYIAAITLANDAIATNAEGQTTAAFVWGILSFFDKIANGIAIMMIQREHTPNHPGYYKYMMACVPGGGAVAAVIAMVGITYFLYVERRRREASLIEADRLRSSNSSSALEDSDTDCLAA